jgi:hypothetical protein
MTMIADFEVNHPLTKKFPALLAFMRAEPIWNWDSDKYPGLSGFNFRFLQDYVYLLTNLLIIRQLKAYADKLCQIANLIKDQARV